MPHLTRHAGDSAIGPPALAPEALHGPAQNHRVTFTDTGLAFDCPSTLSVLDGMAKLGLKGIPVGCKGGGCGVCKVDVLSGDYRKGVMSRSHVSQDEENRNVALACRIYPLSDLEIRVSGKLKKAFGLN